MSEIKDNYFVTGGGTGGHIYPAIAVADELASKGAKIYYVGNKRNMEFGLAKQKGYNFLHVGVSGMPRKLNPKFFLWAIRLVKSIIRSIRYIKKYKPKAVFATGGYVSAPMVFACILTKTPYMMHDCDAMPGLVTRRLSKRAKYISLAFENAKKYIPNKHTFVTGNPIRKEFKLISKQEAKLKMGLNNGLTLCIMGGSQGAKSINNSAIELLREWTQEKRLQIIFQTGKKHYEDVVEQLQKIYPSFEQNENLIIQPYFDDMTTVLKASDIVVSRAGSLSISEICASETAPILIPYPYAAANHQRINAKYLLDVGACLYIEDTELDPNKLNEAITIYLENPIKMNYIKQNCSYLAKFDATDRITELLCEL